MNPIQAPITGTEPDAGPSSPYLALVQFYRAFNGRDMSLMAANWASSEDVAMDNPPRWHQTRLGLHPSCLRAPLHGAGTGLR